MSESFLEQAIKCELTGEWDKAKEIIQKGVKSKITDEKKAELKVVLSYILLTQAAFDEVEQLLNSAEKVAKEANNKKLLGDIYYNFGELAYINCFLREIGDYQQAMEIHKKALAIREEIKDRKGITHSLSRIGVMHERQGEYDTALELHRKALKISKEIDYSLGGERPLIHLGAFEERQGNFQKALEYYQEAMKVKDDWIDEEGQAFRLMNIGGVLYQINKDNDEYLDYLQRGLVIAEKLDHKIAISFISYRLGMFYVEISEEEKALEIFHAIIEFSKPIGFIIPEKIATAQIEKIKQEDV